MAELEKPKRTCAQACLHCLRHNFCVECCCSIKDNCIDCTLHPYDYWVGCCCEPIWHYWISPCVESCRACPGKWQKRCRTKTPEEKAQSKADGTDCRGKMRKWRRVCCSRRDGKAYCLWNTPVDWCKIISAFAVLYTFYACWMFGLMLVYMAFAGYSIFSPDG
eukprot:TRINITY_DN683_c0_g1_i1.p3 TRINITY_DN683_c0_g1~~TRINITY_DN683_c0_g1_i1.p3  ORF type:complete len:163 (-),score=33.08 TRINITY_DN683_c0_g1_i1:257-745(-)